MMLFERRVQLTCAQCGKEFSTPKSKADKGAKYCGLKCFEKARHRRVEFECKVCGKKFQLRPADLHEGRGGYCSWHCYNESRKTRVRLKCLECGKEFDEFPSVLEIGKGKYCSKTCANRASGRERRREFERYVCEFCGKSFQAKLTPAQVKEGNRRFCSRKCFDQARTKRVQKFCEFCGNQFEITIGRQEEGRFCSRKCADTSRRVSVNLTCAVCGKQFQVEPSRAVEGRGKFCSKQCAIRYRGETSIEQLIREELERREIVFETQVKFDRYYVDFLLVDRKIVIECDGKYWHSFADVIKRDRRKEEYLKSLGYAVFRFTESEIRKAASDCVDRVVTKV